MKNLSSLVKQSDRMSKQIEALEIERGHDQAAIDAIVIPDLYIFIKEAWHVIEPGTPFVDGHHIEALAMHLEAVTNGHIKRLLVNMPPRFAKSSIVSVLWPVWSWLHDPTIKWLCASYALSLALRDNRKCRLLIMSPWFQQRYGQLFRFASDQNAKIKFENSARGYRQAVSVGSSTTGEGGDILLGDDFHAIDDKTSDIKRLGALEWFRDTWSTRLNNPQSGAMVVIGQRVHAGDVSGYILSGETGEEWVHLNLAAEFEVENKCRTYINGVLFWEDWRTEEGELLWPERFPEHILSIAKKKHGAVGFASLYQQRPMPAGGGQFKAQWFRYFTIEGEHYSLGRADGIKHVLISSCQCIITVDLAISTKQTADFTVIAVWAITADKQLLLLNRLRDRIDNPSQQKAIIAYYQRYQPAFISIESIAYQLSIVQQLRAQGLPIKEFRPIKDKVSRATSASVYYEGEQVFHPRQATWLQEWEDELLVFPRGSHDDQVDVCSMACEHLAKPRAIGGMMLASDEEIGYDLYADDPDYPGPDDPHSVFWR